MNEFLIFPIEMEKFNEFDRLEEIKTEVNTKPIKFICYLLEGKVVE